MPGGELFHHLDLEGAFDESTSMFFAASVLLALEFLHSKNVVGGAAASLSLPPRLPPPAGSWLPGYHQPGPRRLQ